MKKRGWIVYLLIAFIIFQSQSSARKHSASYIEIYKKAEKLYYLLESSDRNDSIALQYYLEVISLHAGVPDSIIRDANFKAGVYLQTQGKFDKAIPYLKQTLDLGEKLEVLPSLQYLPNIYLGNSYYSVNYLDSAVIFYGAAEEIVKENPGIAGIERLYNTLGVINYESGNYQQSVYYFEKALAVLHEEGIRDVYLLVNYKSNLASSLRKLGHQEKALNDYKDLLAYNVNKDELLHNIGSIYLEAGDDSQAIGYLNKVSYNNPSKYNDQALAYIHLKKYDIAETLLHKAYAEGSGKAYRNVQFGLTCKYLGDLLLNEKKYDSSLQYFQKALGQLMYSFDGNDYRENPTDFQGQYFVMELFETLTAKAHAFTLRFALSHDTADLKSSVDTYFSVYKFTDYISRTYESEEARLFLNNRKHLSHNEPINNCLLLYSLTNNSIYLEKLFEFDEKNKASVLSVQLQESRLKNNSGIPVNLLEEEKTLKQNITALSLKMQSAKDSLGQNNMRSRLRDLHISLADLQSDFDKFGNYRKYRFSDNTVSLKQFQKSIPPHYAVISYHYGDSAIVQLLITNNKVRLYSTSIGNDFAGKILELNKKIKNFQENNSAVITELSMLMYDKLIAHAEPDLKGYSSLMIIPDDELSIVPFGIIENKEGRRLVEDFSVTYNYSCTLVGLPENVKDIYPALSMAPYTRQINNPDSLQALPFSKNEIVNIPGDKIEGSGATKGEFIKRASNYSFIHLATHAAANDENPSGSFIAFYPADPANDTSFKLYASEIFNLSLPKTKLIILSACETGAGQLIKGEGVMSLSRAFAAAGCPGIITSLWKADDQSTSYICIRLHQYLEKGKPVAEALQMSVNDYLKDENIPARKKLPGYWGHLRFTGGFSVDRNSFNSIYLVILSVICVAGLTIYFLKSKL